MKAKSIITINEILVQRARSAKAGYNNRKYELEQKYGTEWLDSVISKDEKAILDDNRKFMNEAIELLKDFEEHQW